MAAQASKIIDDSQRVTVARQLGVRFGDRLVDADRRRGRGASSNPSGRLEAFQRETIDDGWTPDEAPEPLKTEVTVERPRTIITRNEFARHLVRPVDQPLSRLRARLLLLLRAADPRLSGAFRRARLREPSVRQGRRGGAARARAREPEIPAEGDRARRQHRRLSADRAPVPRHPRRARSAGEGAPSGRHRHQVQPGAARPRPARADGGRRPGQGVRLGDDGRSRAGAPDGAARADARAPARGDRAARRRPACRSASWRRRSSRRSTTARSRRS